MWLVLEDFDSKMSGPVVDVLSEYLSCLSGGSLQMNELHPGPLFGEVFRGDEAVAGGGIGFGA